MPAPDVQTTADIRAAMADGATAVEICSTYLARVAAENDAIHAFTHVAGEQALEDAAAVDASGQGRDAAFPLAGVPIAIKDNISTRGMPTTA